MVTSCHEGGGKEHTYLLVGIKKFKVEECIGIG